MMPAVASVEVAEYAGYQIANAELRRYPFPHFYVRPVFPEDFYRELLRRLPPTGILEPLEEAKGARFIGDVADLARHEAGTSGGGLWSELAGWMLGEHFRDLVMRRFQPYIARRFRNKDISRRLEVEARFVRDFTSYSIGPHTDTPAKLVSLLFYLPADDSLREYGTSIYTPVDPDFRCVGTTWYKFSRFRKAMTMEFAPNALFAFFKTDQSFHGVELVKDEGIERNVLLYNIYVNAEPGQPQQGQQ
jgi:hypothetical protein